MWISVSISPFDVSLNPWTMVCILLLYGTHFFQYEVMSEVFTKPLQFQSNVTTLLFRKVLGLKLSQKGLVSELRREKCTRSFGVVVVAGGAVKQFPRWLWNNITVEIFLTFAGWERKKKNWKKVHFHVLLFEARKESLFFATFAAKKQQSLVFSFQTCPWNVQKRVHFLA